MGNAPKHGPMKEFAVHKVIILALACLLSMPYPLRVLQASETQCDDPRNTVRSTPAAAVSLKPLINEIINRHADRFGIDPNLVYAVVQQESGFKSEAVSPKGAMGLMQLMPGTALLMGVSNPFDVEQNIVGGIKYLRHCLVRFNGDLTKALAAYNAGPLHVEKYDGCPPFEETRNYVARIMRIYTGHVPFLAGDTDRFPSPSRRLSPAALAVLKELNPYRYAGTRYTVAEPTGKSFPGKRSAMSPDAMALLKELNPYRYGMSEGNSTLQSGKTKKNRS